jgi:hypothetical protein
MLVECPHCYTKVLPTADNICPACRKDINSLRNINPNLTSISFGERIILPSCCYSCGLDTQRLVTIREKVEIGGASSFEKLVLFWVNLRYKIYGWSTESGEGKKYDLSVKIPQCETCAKQNGKPVPNHVDFENRVVTFIVHKRFKVKLIQMQDRCR